MAGFTHNFFGDAKVVFIFNFDSRELHIENQIFKVKKIMDSMVAINSFTPPGKDFVFDSQKMEEAKFLSG